MENIHLHLTLDEVNTILAALGKEPYINVFQLVSKLQAQAAEQLPQTTPQLN